MGSAQHNYPHWTRVELPEGRHDLATLERIPGVLPFEVYAQAPLRLISWCSFELDNRSKALLRELAILCESPTTSTEQLVAKIVQRQANVCTEQDAIQHLATLATVQIASRAQMPTYTTMVQHFLGHCSCQWQSVCWIITCRCSVRMMATMRQASLCKVPARLERHGNLSSFPTYSKEVSLAIGKSLEDTMLSPSDTRVLPKQMCANCLTVKPTTTKSALLGQADSLPSSESPMQTIKLGECFRPYSD